MRACHRCGVEVVLETVGPRATCEKCRAYLHCCRNCDFYEPGAHNDCREPNAEVVADKEQGNFCDSFHFGERGKAPAGRGGDDAHKKLEALFRKKP